MDEPPSEGTRLLLVLTRALGSHAPPFEARELAANLAQVIVMAVANGEQVCIETATRETLLGRRTLYPESVWGELSDVEIDRAARDAADACARKGVVSAASNDVRTRADAPPRSTGGGRRRSGSG